MLCNYRATRFYSGARDGGNHSAAKAELAEGSLGAETVGELECGAVADGNGGQGEKAAESEEALGFFKGETCAELTGGGAEDAAAKGGGKGAEALDFEGERGFGGGGADGAAAAADRFAGEKEVGEEAVELGLPVGFFFAGDFGEVAKGAVERGIEGAEAGEEVVAEAVSGEGGVAVRGVFAPGLFEGAEVGFDLGAGGGEERAEDLFGRVAGEVDAEDGVDAAEAFGPGAPEELHEDGFGLVVEGVGGENGIGLAALQEGGEEGVAEGAGGFFEGFTGGAGVGGDVDVAGMKGDSEGGAQVGDEVEVGVGFGAAEAVVEVGCGEADAERGGAGLIGGVEGAEEGYRVGAAGDGDADAMAGGEVLAVEGEGRSTIPVGRGHGKRQCSS